MNEFVSLSSFHTLSFVNFGGRPQVRGGPSVGSVFKLVVYRNSSIPDTALSVTKREVDEEWNEHANELSPAITDNQSNANLST